MIDRAIQAHGAGGVSEDFPLAGMWIFARTLRIADGPDAVHMRTIAQLELQRKRNIGKLSPLEYEFEKMGENLESLSALLQPQEKLRLYGLFKQAQSGDCQDRDRPNDPQHQNYHREVAKFETWKELKGKSKEESMKEYILLIKEVVSRKSKL